jgi:hypothetical protein
MAIAAMQVAPSLRDPARPPSADRLKGKGLLGGTARIRSVGMTSATGPSDLHGPLSAIKKLGLLLLAARRCLDCKWGLADRPRPSCCNAANDGSRSDVYADS